MARKPSPQLLVVVSDNLKSLRADQQLTQAELGARCNMLPNQISNIEQATLNITLATIEELARGLGCYEEDIVRRRRYGKR